MAISTQESSNALDPSAVGNDTPINPGSSGGPLVNMRGEVVGLNTLKLIKKNTSGIAFALSASDLLDVLHRFYPVAAPTSSGTVRFEGTAGAEIYVDGNFVGHIPSAVPLPEGRYEILIEKRKISGSTKAADGACRK